MRALAPVICVEACVVGAAGSASVAEHQNVLAPVHEVISFGLVRTRRPRFEFAPSPCVTAAWGPVTSAAFSVP